MEVYDTIEIGLLLFIKNRMISFLIKISAPNFGRKNLTKISKMILIPVIDSL
jgi:hypothetical protein